MPAFVCRDGAVASLTAALEHPPALVLVEGEAGIGKTRLVSECLAAGSLADRTVLMVTCPPLTEPEPFAPVVAGLRRLRERIRGVKLSPLGGALRPLFPEWREDLPPPLEPVDDARQTRGRIYRALTELVDRLGIDALVFEDAHWADPASLEWLVTMTASGSGSRSVVVTYRREEVPDASPLRQVISRMPAGMALERIAPKPLTAAGVQQLTKSMFRGLREVSEEFAAFVHARTGGLPLAVEECLRLLRARGDIAREGDSWGRRALVELRVPPTVRESVLERVDRLPPAVRRMLAAAAVLGEPAAESLLAAVAGMDPPAARPAVAAALRSGLLGSYGPGRVGFRHQLAAEAVEDAIPATEHERLLQRAGELLQAVDGVSAARLCRHFDAAGDVSTWSRYAEAGADLAAETGDDLTVINVLHELLTVLDHPPRERARLARKLGYAA
ncbi:MAG: ATP-binding protein, partial [Natronosporangium sp.]